ncbi:hypothetical protein [Rubritalea marina]|uniref:hypothetical protein n=1 Tax=Rubritalea marina TaxID=361055 RepID=UPI00036339FD|nr:hypothetical protein [Rubritalea marina]
MDKDKAKLILGSFRPDGADASSPDFTEALQLAVEDRDLGAWLARERAQDSFFAECLAQVAIPQSLRDDLLASMEDEKARINRDDPFESSFSDGMHGIEVPDGLRDQILTAMTVEQDLIQFEKRENRMIWPALTGVAAAVAVSVLVVFNQSDHEAEPQQLVSNSAEIKPLTSKVPAESVAQVAVNRMTTQLVHQVAQFDQSQLQHTHDDTNQAIGVLVEQNLPAPHELPEGLKCAKFVGLQTMLLEDGKSVSLLGFDCPKIGLVYLAVMDIHNLSNPEELVTADSITLKNCYGCSLTHYNFVPWKDGDHAYLILTKGEKEQMIDLF